MLLTAPEGAAPNDLTTPLLRFGIPLATSSPSAAPVKGVSHPRPFSGPRRISRSESSLPYFVQAPPMGFKERGAPLSPSLPQDSIKTPVRGNVRAKPCPLTTYFTKKSARPQSLSPIHDPPTAARPRGDNRRTRTASKLTTASKDTLPSLRGVTAREHRGYTWFRAEALTPCAALPTTPNKHPRPLTVDPCEQG